MSITVEAVKNSKPSAAEFTLSSCPVVPYVDGTSVRSIKDTTGSGVAGRIIYPSSIAHESHSDNFTE